MKVLDNTEYIIEPGTDFREVVNFFNTVHWSMNRMAGLHSVIERSNITGDSFVLFLKDSVPHIKRLKEVKEID